MRTTLRALVGMLVVAALAIGCGTVHHDRDRASPHARPAAQSLPTITAAIPQPDQMGAGYVPIDLATLKPSGNDPTFAKLSNPRQVPICHGQWVGLSARVRAERRAFVRPNLAAPKPALKSAVIVTAAVYPTRAEAETDYARIRAWECPATIGLTHQRISGTWQQTTGAYGTWTRVHAVRTLDQPTAEPYRRVTVGVYEYLIRGNVIVATLVMDIRPSDDTRPAVSDSARILAQWIGRLR